MATRDDPVYSDVHGDPDQGADFGCRDDSGDPEVNPDLGDNLGRKDDHRDDPGYSISHSDPEVNPDLGDNLSYKDDPMKKDSIGQASNILGATIFYRRITLLCSD